MCGRDQKEINLIENLAKLRNHITNTIKYCNDSGGFNIDKSLLNYLNIQLKSVDEILKDI